jgi:hypothetical protein
MPESAANRKPGAAIEGTAKKYSIDGQRSQGGAKNPPGVQTVRFPFRLYADVVGFGGDGGEGACVGDNREMQTSNLELWALSGDLALPIPDS